MNFEIESDAINHIAFLCNNFLEEAKDICSSVNDIDKELFSLSKSNLQAIVKNTIVHTFKDNLSDFLDNPTKAYIDGYLFSMQYIVNKSSGFMTEMDIKIEGYSCGIDSRINMYYNLSASQYRNNRDLYNLVIDSLADKAVNVIQKKRNTSLKTKNVSKSELAQRIKEEKINFAKLYDWVNKNSDYLTNRKIKEKER